MERMIGERRTFHLERRGLLSPHQSGFRKGRGTMDPICSETETREAQMKKEFRMAEFFMWRRLMIYGKRV